MKIISYAQREDATGVRLLEGQEKEAFLKYVTHFGEMMKNAGVQHISNT